jgi:hypothetical protein
MMTVGQLAQNFLSLDPQKSPARMAFYHYIKNFLKLDDEFRQDMIDAFYDRALSLQHWQANKDQLGEMIRGDLKAIAARHPFGFDVEQIVHAHEMQVIQIEQTRDFAALLSKEVTKMEKNGEKVKSFRLNADKNSQIFEVLFVRLQSSGSLIAEIRQNTALLVDGELHLVRPHSRLTYSAELDFEPHIDQFLTTSLMRVARFQVSGSQSAVAGQFIQGPSFHKAENFGSEKALKTLTDIPELLHAIKKVERYYVNPVTDPYYQQMIDNFEQAFHEKNSGL